MMNKLFENDSFNRRIVEKIVEYRDRLHDEESLWKQISLDLSEDIELDCSHLRWQDFSTYFKRSLVFKLSHRRFLDDQELIDRLQYPFLRKVYVLTIKFFEKELTEKGYGQSASTGNVEDHKLFIKYVLDGRYDPNVVAAFKRRCRKGQRIYVNINIADPAYNLPEDVKKLLLQIGQSRKERASRPPAVNDDRKESSPVMLDGVSVPIEDGSPHRVEFSARDLLDKESFTVNTQEYDDIVKESLEQELSPVSKKRKIDYCGTQYTEIWLEPNEILSSTASQVPQNDPLNLSERNVSAGLNIIESSAGDHQQDICSNLPLLVSIKTEDSTLEQETNKSQDPLIQVKEERKLNGNEDASIAVVEENISFSFPDDFISDDSSDSVEELDDSGRRVNTKTTMIDENNVPASVDNLEVDLGYNGQKNLQSAKNNTIKSEANLSKLATLEKENASPDEFVFPPDFISDHSSDSEDESADDISIWEGPNSIHEVVKDQESNVNPPVTASSQPEVSSVDRVTPKINASQSAVQLSRPNPTTKMAINAEIVASITLMNNSLDMVPSHYIMKKRSCPQVSPMDSNLPSVTSVKAVERSKDTSKETSGKQIQPEIIPTAVDENENFHKTKEIVETSPTKRLESETCRGMDKNCDSGSSASSQLVPACGNTATSPRSGSSTPMSIRLFYSSDSNTAQMVPQSPPSASSPTMLGPIIQQIHAVLRPAIESRLRFLIVLRTCWPELFLKEGTFGDFYELMSVMAVNLFPKMRPVDCVRVLELGQMFSAIACRIAYGHCLRLCLCSPHSTVGSEVSQRLDGREKMDQQRKGSVGKQSSNYSSESAAPTMAIEIRDSGSDIDSLPVRKKNGDIRETWDLT